MAGDGIIASNADCRLSLRAVADDIILFKLYESRSN